MLSILDAESHHESDEVSQIKLLIYLRILQRILEFKTYSLRYLWLR